MGDLGLTREEWDEFSANGLIVRENVLDTDLVDELVEAIDRQPVYAQWNAVQKDPAFTSLIDLEQHFWLVYDIYGEAMKLTRSEYFRREPGSIQRNRWHFDGPRNLTFQGFGARLPFRIKVAYWLTDLKTTDMGNFTYLPRSHRNDRFDGYHTHEPWPGEVQVLAPAGSMSVMWGGLWHRVAPNDSEVVRKNIFLEYAPSWIVSGDRHFSDPEWLTGLTRRQQAVMRSYASANDLVKLPDEHVPLVPVDELERTGRAVPTGYGDHVPLRLRKFPTRAEVWAADGIRS